MKKMFLTLVSVFAVLAILNAQDLTSKKGEAYLPEADDWAIGVDAAPFLNYFGGFLSNAGAAAPTWNFFPGTQTIFGKMFIDSETAYRGKIQIGFGSNSVTDMVADRNVATPPAYPALPALVENKWVNSGSVIGLSAGLEKRRGSTRLQGFYGAEGGIFMASSKDAFTYGNNLVAPNAGNPGVTVDADDIFAGSGNIINDTYGNAARVLERKNGSVFGLGLRGFIGAEYFILPKLSLAGEFGWGLNIASQGKTVVDIESIGAVAGGGQVTGQQTLEGVKAGGFNLNTDNFGACIYMIFHF